MNVLSSAPLRNSAPQDRLAETRRPPVDLRLRRLAALLRRRNGKTDATPWELTSSELVHVLEDLLRGDPMYDNDAQPTGGEEPLVVAAVAEVAAGTSSGSGADILSVRRQTVGGGDPAAAAAGSSVRVGDFLRDLATQQLLDHLLELPTDGGGSAAAHVGCCVECGEEEEQQQQQAEEGRMRHCRSCVDSTCRSCFLSATAGGAEDAGCGVVVEQGEDGQQQPAAASRGPRPVSQERDPGWQCRFCREACVDDCARGRVGQAAPPSTSSLEIDSARPQSLPNDAAPISAERDSAPKDSSSAIPEDTTMLTSKQEEPAAAGWQLSLPGASKGGAEAAVSPATTAAKATATAADGAGLQAQQQLQEQQQQVLPQMQEQQEQYQQLQEQRRQQLLEQQQRRQQLHGQWLQQMLEQRRQQVLEQQQRQQQMLQQQQQQVLEQQQRRQQVLEQQQQLLQQQQQQQQQRLLLRLLLRAILAGTNGSGAAAGGGLVWPTLTEVEDAVALLRGFTERDAFPLWARVGTSTTGIKALAVALRRAGAVAEGVPPLERLVYMRLACGLSHSFLAHVVALVRYHAADVTQSAAWPRVIAAVVAILQSQALQCLARAIGREQEAEAGATASMPERRPEVSAGRTASAQQQQQGAGDGDAAVAGSSSSSSSALQQQGAGGGGEPSLFQELCDAQFACTSFLVRGLAFAAGQQNKCTAVSAEGESHVREFLTKRLLTALWKSCLLEHAAKLARHVKTDPCHAINTDGLSQTGLCWLLGRANRPQGFVHRLPYRPCLHFLATAAVVEVLHRCDGGPRYGLPTEASEAARRLLLAEGPTAEVYRQSWAVQEVLTLWTRLLAPGTGCPPPPDGLFVSASGIYQLCLRISAVSLGAARSGSWLAAGAARDRAGSSSSSGSDADIPCRLSDVLCCHVAASALVAAHEALQGPLNQPPAHQPPQQPPRAAQAPPRPLSASTSTAPSVACPAPATEAAATEAAAGAVVEAAAAGAVVEAAAAARPGGAEAVQLPQVRPEEWWRAGAEAMHTVAALRSPHSDASNPSAGCPIASDAAKSQRKLDFLELRRELGLLLHCQLGSGQMAMELPGVLPPSPPPDVAAALSSGYLPSLEHLLRRQVHTLFESPHTLQRLLSWPALGWLLAYGDARQAAALVVTVGKVLLVSNSLRVFGSDYGTDDNGRGCSMGMRRVYGVQEHVVLALAAMKALTDGLDWAETRHKALQRRLDAGGAGGARARADGAGGVGPSEVRSTDGVGSSSSSSGDGNGGGCQDGSTGGGSSGGGGGGALGDRGGAAEDEEVVTEAAGHQLSRLLSLAVLHWAPALCGACLAVTDTREAPLERPNGDAAASGLDSSFFAAFLQLLPRLLDAIDTAAYDDGDDPRVGGSGYRGLPPDEALAWSHALRIRHATSILSLLGAKVGEGGLTLVDAAVLRLALRRVLWYFPEQVRGGFPGSWARRGDVSLLVGPDGPLPDPELHQLLQNAAWKDLNGETRRALLAPLQPQQPARPLPLGPLLWAHSPLRICGDRRCTNLAGDSELELEPQLAPCSRGCGVAWFCCNGCEEGAMPLAHPPGGCSGRV